MEEVCCLTLEKRRHHPGPNLDFSGVMTEGEKWTLGDMIHNFAVLLLYALNWFARVVLVLIPQRVSLCGVSSALGSSSSMSGGQDQPFESEESELQKMNVSRSGPIGRALLQVLALVNDLPASSTKYSFARALAEKIIQENASHGHGFESVNRGALAAGFERTLLILNRSLEGLHQQRSSAGELWRLPVRLLGMVSRGGFNLAFPRSLSLVGTQIGHFIPSLSKITSTAPVFSNSGDVFTGSGLSATSAVGNTEMAEKLAQELLWLAEKLAEISALDEAIVQWCWSSSLATISLRSSPHVQRALVRLSALFVKELTKSNYEAARDVKFKLLFRWLPLFCAASHGGDGAIFTISERMDLENNLEKIIKSLPDSDQEVILAIWLQEYALSSSDWPNLQSCYENWCNFTRKLRPSGVPLQSC